MFHEDFDKSTHNSFFSVSNKQPSLAQRHRDRLPPIQTQLDAAFNSIPAHRQVYPGLGSPPFDPTHPRVHIHPPPILSPTGRSGSISPESYFAAPVIEHIKRKRARQAAMAAAHPTTTSAIPATLGQLAGLVDDPGRGKLGVPVGLGPVKTNTSSALGAVGSSGVGVVSEEERERERRRRERRELRHKEKKEKEHKSSKEKDKSKEGKEHKSKEGKEGKEKERSREHKSKSKDPKKEKGKEKEKDRKHRHRSKSRDPSSSKHKEKAHAPTTTHLPSSFQSLEDHYPDPHHPDRLAHAHANVGPAMPSGPLHPSLNPRYSPNHLGLGGGDQSFNPGQLATSTPIDALHPLGGGYTDSDHESDHDDDDHDDGGDATPTPLSPNPNHTFAHDEDGDGDDTGYPHPHNLNTGTDIGDGNTSLGTGLYPPRLEDGSAFPTSQENARMLRNLAPDFPPEVPTPRSNVFRFGAPLTDSPRAMFPGGGGGGNGAQRPNAERQASLPEYSALDPYATFGEGEQGSGDTYGEGYGVGVGLTPASPRGYTGVGYGLGGSGGGGNNGYLGAAQEKARLSRIHEGSYEEEDTRDVGGGGGGDESTRGSSTSSYGNPDYPQTLGGRSEFDERASGSSGASQGGHGDPSYLEHPGHGDGEETVSLIGSNASDLRPNGRIPHTGSVQGEGVDVDGGGMVNPKRGGINGNGDGRGGEGGGGGGIPRSAVSGVGVAHAFSPSSANGHPLDDGERKRYATEPGPNPSSIDLNAQFISSDPTNNLNSDNRNKGEARDPTSRKSALLRLDPEMLVNFVLRAEADYDALSQLYTQALAEAAIASHTTSLTLQKTEKKLKEEEERNKALRAALEESEREKRVRDGVVVGLERRVREKEREVKKVKEEKREVEKEVEEVRGRLEGEREKRKAEEERRREVEKTVAPLKVKLADLQATLARTQAQARARIAELEQEKADVERTLNEELARERKKVVDTERELTVLRLEHGNVKNDLERAKVVVGGLEERLKETQEELSEAKRKARKMRAEAVAMVAKEEGRREGWEEGMRRGRGMVEALAVGVGLGPPRLAGPGDGMAYIEEVAHDDEDDDDARRRRKKEKEREKKKERERERERERELRERERMAREAALSEADASHAREMSAVLARLAELEGAVEAERSKTMELTKQRELARSEVGSVVGRVYELEGRLEREKADRERERERLEQQMALEREREREREERERERREREVERERERVRDEERQRAKEQISRVEEEKEELQRMRRQRERELEAEQERLRQRRREIEEEDEVRRKEIEEDVKRGKMKEEEADELRKQLEKEKEEKLKLEKELKEAKTPQITLSYLPMPPPPQPTASTSQMPVPMVMPGVASSTGSSNWRGRRRAGTDSGSESDLGTLDILNLPNFGEEGVVSAREGRRRDREKQKQRDLSTIREVASFTSGATPSPHMSGQAPPPPPIWVSQPPPNLANGYPASGGSSYNPAGGPMQMPRPEDYLSPHGARGGNERPSLRKMGSGSSGSTYDIKVVPPSRPDSSNRNREGYQYPPAAGPYKSPFLSPNSAQQPLPHPPRVPGPYDRPPSAAPTQPNSPYSVPGGLPIGFVPQSMTPASSGVGMPAPVVNGENLDERRRHRRESAMDGSSMRPDAGMNMPRPESSMRSDAGFGMPTPSGHTYGSQTPASTLGRRTPAAGSGIGMPEPTVPNIVRPPTRSSAGTRTPATSGIGMPEPTIPNIVRPPTRGTTAGSRTPGTSTIGMPEPTVPLFIPPPGSATGRTPAGGSTMTMPEPTIPNIVGRTPSGGSAITMPEPTVPNIVPSPSGGAPQTLRKKGRKEKGSRRNGGMSMPEPTVPSYAPTSPAPGGRAMPDPEIVALMGGHHVTPPPEFTPVIPPGMTLDMPGGLGSPMTMPEPTVVDYTGAALSSGRQSAAPLPVLPSSLRDRGGPGMPTPTVMGMPLASPVIPGVTTPLSHGGMGITETGEPPFIPPADVMARAASPARSASGGGAGSGGVFGGIGNMFGGSNWGPWGGGGGSRSGSGAGDDDEEEAGGKFTGGFIPPGVATGEDDDEDMDSQTARNTRMNAEMSRGGVAMPEPEVSGKRGKKKKKR